MSRINNVFEGGGGNDTIIGRVDHCHMYDRRGRAHGVSYDHALAAVTVDLRAGKCAGTAAGDVADVGNDTFSSTSAA